MPKRILWAPPQFEKEVHKLTTERAVRQKFNEERRQERDAKIAAAKAKAEAKAAAAAK